MAQMLEHKAALKEKGEIQEVPSDVLKRVAEAEKAILGDEVRWQEALAFMANDQYVFVSAVDNTLDRLETREGGAKPRYRMRLTRNRMTMQMVNEASFLVSRIPEYEVQSPNQDGEIKNQAKLGEMALADQHEKLKLDMVAIETVLLSMATGAGFTWPYWDPEAGEWLGEYDGTDLAIGEIKLWRLHQGEVLWQAGLPFDESPWVCVRKAVPVEHVQSRKGYIGPERLPSDAKAGLWERPGSSRPDMCFLYQYLERQCREHPKGRWLTFAGKHLVREKADYPRSTNEPCIHKMPWIPMPHKHRDLGAGEMLVDIQRTWNRTLNQIIAWKNLVLVPQMKAPVGSMQSDPTDEYGVVWEYRPIAGKEPEWREVPEIPLSLFKMLDLCLEDFDHVLGFESLPPGVESAQGVSAFTAREAGSKNLFLKGMARWYASQGYHLLELIQENYTEPRLLEVQGRFGVDRIPDFVGHKLGRPGGVTVRVSSIEPRTKAQMEARLMGYAERGWIDPHQAMAAISGGVAAQLVEDFELDIARQHREIKQLLAIGGQQPDPTFQRAMQLYALTPGADGSQIPPHLFELLPGLPMAEDYDDHVVHIDVLRQWMKTSEFEHQPPLVQQAARNHLAQHEQLQDQAFMKEVLRQQTKAQALGIGNASRDQVGKAAPSPASQATLAGRAQQPKGE